MTKVAKYTVIACLFAIPFLSLYVAGSSFFPFITGKNFLFRILIEAAFAAYVVLVALDARYRPRFSWTMLLYVLFASWLFIADAFAINPHKAFWSNFERMEGYVTLIHVFLFFLVAGAVLPVERLWKRWWQFFIAAAALVCGYSLLQLMGLAQIHQGGVRVDGTLGNAAYLAAYLMFALAITAWQAFESKGWARYLLAGLAAVEVIIIFNTATRGAILGVVGAAVLAAGLWMIESGKKGRTAAAGALIAILALAGAFWLARDTSFVKESPIFSRIASISVGELQVRFTLWDMAREGMLERPLTGYGQEGFNYVFNEHYRPALYAQEPWFDRAHNAFIDWLMAGGIPAFLLFIALLFSAVIALYRNREVSHAERIFFTAALAGYSLQALVVFDNLFTYIPLAAIFAMAHFASSRPVKKLDALPALRNQNRQMTLAAVAAAGALVVIWTVNFPNMAAAHDLVYAVSPIPGGPQSNLDYFKRALGDHSFATQEIREQLITYAGNVANSQAPDQLKIQVTGLAITEMQKEEARAPKDARVHMQLALGYRIAGMDDKALDEVNAAIALSPKRQSFYVEKGHIYIAMGKMKEAADAFQQAYAFDTSFDALAGAVAAGDVYAGDTRGAKEFLAARFGTTTIDSTVLAQAYYDTKQYGEIVPILELQARNAHNDADALLRLASGYALAGRFAEARATLLAVIKTHPDKMTEAQSMLARLPAGK